MKVFFTASMRGQKQYKHLYEKIYRTIKDLGYESIDDEIISRNSNSYYHKLEKEGRKAYIDMYKNNIRSLNEADICVFECTLHSLSIGFVIQKALESNKPVIVLYYKDNLPHFLMGIQEEKLMIKSYTEDTIKKALKETLKEARERKDKRFNFFITPKLLNYLETTTKELGVTKSKFIRSLIFDYMKKNPLEARD